MPIANCFLHQVNVSNQQLDQLTKEWAEKIEVDIKDICLSFIEVTHQIGQNYKVMVNLHLPTLWNESNVQRIQVSLYQLLKKHLKLETEGVFIITHSVQSGHVTENGQIVKW